jgi:hypothetical protein
VYVWCVVDLLGGAALAEELDEGRALVLCEQAQGWADHGLGWWWWWWCWAGHPAMGSRLLRAVQAVGFKVLRPPGGDLSAADVRIAVNCAVFCRKLGPARFCSSS